MHTRTPLARTTGVTLAAVLMAASIWMLLSPAAGRSLTTSAPLHAVLDGHAVSDTITITGFSGTGALTSFLRGPVAVRAGQSCSEVSDTAWRRAPSAVLTERTTGDGVIHGAPVTVTRPGCYAFVSSFSDAGRSFTSSAAFVTMDPRLLTTASPSVLVRGGRASAVVAVTGLVGPGVVATDLVGPASPVDGSCTDVAQKTWDHLAPRAPLPNLSVSGSGVSRTASAAIGRPGCYTFAATLRTGGGNVSGPVGQPGGTVTEVNPTISVERGVQVVAVERTDAGGVGNDIVVTGLLTSGVLDDALIGPVAPVRGSCAAIPASAWASAPTAASTKPIFPSGSGSYLTSTVTVSHVGCYGWSPTLVVGGQRIGAGPIVGTVAAIHPTVTTSAYRSGARVTDVVTITGANGLAPFKGQTEAGIAEELLGPVQPVRNSCRDITQARWSHAGIAAETNNARYISGSGTYRLGPTTTLTRPGCYSFTTEFVVGGSRIITPPGMVGATIRFR